jgi:DNA-binding MarR family transcriptional regulator
MNINLSKLLCYKLFYVVKLNEQLIDQAMEPFHLSRTQWKIIVRFNFLPIPCTQQQLLTSMGIDRAHLTRTLEQLELRHLITRERVPTDKRSFHIVLTTAGKKLLRKIEHILQLESEAMVNGLTQSEQSTLRKLIDKVESNILLELEGNP